MITISSLQGLLFAIAIAAALMLAVVLAAVRHKEIKRRKKMNK